MHVGEDQQPGYAVWQSGNGVEDGLGNEGKRALGPDEQVPEDLQRLVEVDERVQAVAGGVLAGVLGVDAPAQLGVGEHLLTQLEQAGCKLGLLVDEQRGGAGRGGVDQRARREQEGQ